MKVVEGFRGKYVNTLDSKNRVFVPAGFRDKLTEGMTIIDEADGNLSLYPNEEWEKKIAAMELDYDRDEDRTLLRHYYADAQPINMDAQGRIIIPQELRDFAGLTKDVLFTGVRNLIEIWDPEKYEENRKAQNLKQILNRKAEEKRKITP